MNRTDELFDNRIADWLEEDPVRAPAQLLETVLAALPSVPQRRAGSAWQPAALPRWWQLVAAAALVVVIGLLGLKALTPPTVAPSQSPEPSVTEPAQTSTPAPTRSAPVVTATPAAGDPLPEELLGAWSHAAGGWWWFLPPGDLECVQAVHTAEACAVWDRQVTTAEIGSVTYAANVVSIRWRSGFCNGVTGVYTVQLEGDALTLIEHPGGCEGDNLVLTRAGTGSAPTAPPPPTP